MWWRPQGPDGLAGGEDTSSPSHLRCYKDISYTDCYKSSRFLWDSLVRLQGVITFLGVRVGGPNSPTISQSRVWRLQGQTMRVWKVGLTAKRKREAPCLWTSPSQAKTPGSLAVKIVLEPGRPGGDRGLCHVEAARLWPRGSQKGGP